jgi:hypothetical protein
VSFSPWLCDQDRAVDSYYSGEQAVQEFYTAALKAGAKDNGPPGQRPRFGPNYYAAFVWEPVFGSNLEVLYRG